MNNELKIFENKEFGQVRVLTIDNEPWFVGKDISEILGYKDTVDAIKRHVDKEDRILLSYKEFKKYQNGTS